MADNGHFPFLGNWTPNAWQGLSGGLVKREIKYQDIALPSISAMIIVRTINKFRR
jgi:hypothetical protein